MSERQAKLKRKNESGEVTAKRKKTKGEIITNVIIVAAVIAVLGLGSWAVASKYIVKDNSNQQDTQVTDDNASQQTIPTVGEYAENLGMSTEDFMKEYGVEGNDAVTADTDMETASQQMTLANYAKMSGTDAAGLRESFGLDDTVSDDTLMSEVNQIMAEKEASEESENNAETENNAEQAGENE